MRVWLLTLSVALCALECLRCHGAEVQDHLSRLGSIRKNQWKQRSVSVANFTIAQMMLARPRESLSHALWMRYTHPRSITTEPQHSDETIYRASMEVPLDHLDENYQAQAHWTQVYYRNNASHVAGGPAFVMLSGTEGYESDWLREGHMADLARKFNADRFFLMTRFFGSDNHPTANTSTASLAFLTVEQILGDVAFFLDTLLAEGELQPKQKVILFGAGFGGTIATWARLRFPDIVHGVVASGPTLEPTYDTHSYFPVVSHAADWYHRKDLQCEDYQRAAFLALDSSLSSAKGRRNFNRAFQPCTPFPEDAPISAVDRAHVLGLVASAVATLVQEDFDGRKDNNSPGGDALYPYCYVLKMSTDSPLQTLGMLVTTIHDGHCLETSVERLVDSLSATDWSSDANRLGLRQWMWLQCSELGQLPTTMSDIYFPYSFRIDIDFYKWVCKAVFGDEATSSLIANIDSLSKTYGGKTPTDISNAIFVKGDLDPWKDLAPAKDFRGANETHVFEVLRASHAHDMFPRDDYDPPWMKKTRKAIATVLERWLRAT